MLRVAFLTPSLHVGGAELWICTLARHFQRTQTVAVVHTCPDFWHPMIVRRIPCEIFRPMASTPQQTPAALRRVTHEACRHADVLVAWGEKRLPECTRDLEIPVVLVSHSAADFPGNCELLRTAGPAANSLAAVSKQAAKAFPGAWRGRVSVIYNGVEVERCLPRCGPETFKAAWGDVLMAVFLGRFAEAKGATLFAEAVAALPDGWQGAMYGHGPDAQLCRQIGGNKLGIYEPTANIGDLLAAATVVVLPSATDGMPTVAMEAMAAGAKLVATETPAMQELDELAGAPVAWRVGQDCGGEELADAICDAHQHNETMADNLANNRAAIFERFNASAMAGRWESYLQAVVDKYRAGAQ